MGQAPKINKQTNKQTNKQKTNAFFFFCNQQQKKTYTTIKQNRNRISHEILAIIHWEKEKKERKKEKEWKRELQKKKEKNLCCFM